MCSEKSFSKGISEKPHQPKNQRLLLCSSTVLYNTGMHAALNVHTSLVGLPQNRNQQTLKTLAQNSFSVINHANKDKDKHVTLTQKLLDGL